MSINGKELTITANDLTEKEAEELAGLMRMGDSEGQALWSIQHICRPCADNESFYRAAYTD